MGIGHNHIPETGLLPEIGAVPFAYAEPFSRDDARIRRLLQDHLDGITRYLGRLGVASSEVEDVAQEVFLIASSKLGAVPLGSERAFLHAIASRVAHNARRASVRRHRAYERYLHIDPDPVPTQEELSDHLRARVLFDAVLQELPEELRQVFVLCEIESLPIPEVAQRFGLPIGTVASRLRRAREAFCDRFSRSTQSKGRGRGRSDELIGPEILSWWVSDGEVDALRALLDIYRRCHPGASVVHGGIRGTATAKGMLSARMAEGTPPDTFQTNGGYDLWRWARGGGAKSPEGSLEPLEFLFETEQWRSVFSQDVLDLVSHSGEAYAVPLNIHRTNTIFSDIGALNRAEIEAPRTLGDLHRVAATLKKRGMVPLSIGARQPWVLSLIAFENLLVAIAGGAFYRQFFEGKGSPNAPEIRETLGELGALLDVCNADAQSLGWDEAVDRVRTGAATMTIMGDWAKGYLERRGCFDGEHFSMTPSPGTENCFVFTMDTFGLPRGAPHRESAIDLLRVFGSPHGQSTFNRIKGSLPARSDVLSRMPHSDGEARTRREFEVSERVPTMTSLVPPSFSSKLDAALGDFARDRDANRVIAVIESEYGQLED